MRYALVAALAGAAVSIPAALAAPPVFPSATAVARALLPYEARQPTFSGHPVPFRHMTCAVTLPGQGTALLKPGIYVCAGDAGADAGSIEYHVWLVRTTPLDGGRFRFAAQGTAEDVCPASSGAMRCIAASGGVFGGD